MKTCNACGEAKSPTDYYARQGQCKDCVKRRVRANRKENSEYYKEFDRQRASNPERVAARAAYANTAAGKLAMRKASKAWDERNPERRLASTIVGNAIRDGKLIKMPCEVCGTSSSVEGHHPDYSKPLEVRWLCTAHHAEHHKQERENAREEQSWP